METSKKENHRKRSLIQRLRRKNCKLIRKIPGVRMLGRMVDKGKDIISSLLNVPNQKELNEIAQKLKDLDKKFDQLNKNLNRA